MRKIFPVLLILHSSASLAVTATWRAPEPRDAWTLGGLATTAALSEFALPQAPFGVRRWEPAIDRWAREKFKADETLEQKRVAGYSDAAVGTAVLLPYVMDMAAFAMGSHNNELAERIALINLEALFANTTLTSLTKGLVGRERPDVSDCVRDRGAEICLNREATRSFVSGHASYAFMSAGLICLHHTQLGLAGNAFADSAICGGALALAAATGAMRVIADRHYLTDVLAGALIGMGTGYVLPAVLFSAQSVSTSPVRTAPSVSLPLVQWPL